MGGGNGSGEGIAGKIANKAAKAAVHVAEKVEQAVAPQHPPPPVVWGITLKRNPPLTKEDEPPTDGCVKFLLKCFLIPFALFAHAFGWAVWGELDDWRTLPELH